MKRCLIAIWVILLAGTVFACSTDGLFPDPQCTPGEVFEEVGIQHICVKGYSATVRNVPKALKNKVYEAYSIPKSERKNFVIDHLISLQIGGTNGILNLFPQRTTGVINSRTKDKIENFLKREVCKGNMTLKEAQRLIVTDWLEIWEDFSERGDR